MKIDSQPAATTWIQEVPLQGLEKNRGVEWRKPYSKAADRRTLIKKDTVFKEGHITSLEEENVLG